MLLIAPHASSMRLRPSGAIWSFIGPHACMCLPQYGARPAAHRVRPRPYRQPLRAALMIPHSTGRRLRARGRPASRRLSPPLRVAVACAVLRRWGRWRVGALFRLAVRIRLCRPRSIRERDIKCPPCGRADFAECSFPPLFSLYPFAASAQGASPRCGGCAALARRP